MADIDYEALAKALTDVHFPGLWERFDAEPRQHVAEQARAVVAAYQAQMREQGVVEVRADDVDDALVYVEKYRNLARSEPFPHADRTIAALRAALSPHAAPDASPVVLD